MKPADASAAIARGLEAAGLVVELRPPASGYALRVCSGSQTLPGSAITIFEDMGHIIARPGQWGFAHWMTCPGPGPEDLEYWVATAEELITVTTRFFLGEPCLIEGWVVPLHRHPDWDDPAYVVWSLRRSAWHQRSGSASTSRQSSSTIAWVGSVRPPSTHTPEPSGGRSGVPASSCLWSQRRPAPEKSCG